MSFDYGPEMPTQKTHSKAHTCKGLMAGKKLVGSDWAIT